MREPMNAAVVIPAKDRAHVIARAIASVRAQTVPPLEIIVVDDGSKDRTAAILSSARSEATARIMAAITQLSGQERSTAVNVARSIGRVGGPCRSCRTCRMTNGRYMMILKFL